jgi:hypothetical protein
LANNELGDFEFTVAIIIWYEILSVVNLISKHVQAKDMLIDVAIKSGDNSDIDGKVLHVALKFLQEFIPKRRYGAS